MCGIVGIYLKNERLKDSLGSLLSKMLINMGSRGPDSAGFAIYKKEDKNKYKYSICINDLSYEDFKERINKHINAELNKNSDHVIIKTSSKPSEVLKIIKNYFSEVSIVGYGRSIEIFKQVGDPADVVKRFNIDGF